LTFLRKQRRPGPETGGARWLVEAADLAEGSPQF
jgi:hypothetical protein